MDDAGQVSIEYLILVGVGLVFAAVIALLVSNIFAIKESIKASLADYRLRLFQ